MDLQMLKTKRKKKTPVLKNHKMRLHYYRDFRIFTKVEGN